MFVYTTIGQRLDDHAAWLARGGNGAGRFVERGGALRNQCLRNAELRNADLRGADLNSADLRGADLRGAKLSGANLPFANLAGADLGGADLRGANLTWTNLAGADLGGADLRCANLNYSELEGAGLSGAIGVAVARPRGDLVVAVDHGSSVMILFGGLSWKSAAKMVESVGKTYARAPAARDAYITAIEALADQIMDLAEEEEEEDRPLEPWSWY